MSDLASRHPGGDPRSNTSYVPRFTDITPTPTSVWLSAEWHPFLFPAGGWLDVLATHDLQTNAWEIVGTVPVAPAETNIEVEVLAVDLPDGTNGCAFFRLDARPIYDPALYDTDGDGLTDEEETGTVAVMPSFEWHDTAGFFTAYGLPPYSGGGISLYMGASISAYFPAGVAVGCVPCGWAMAFENCFVSLVEPDVPTAWVFPERIFPLNVAGFNSGTILVAPYWGFGYVQYGNTNSYLRAGTLVDGTTVIEFHDVKRNLWSNDGMTCQVIVPGGTGNVVRVSYLSSDVWIDGSDGVTGVHNKRRVLPDGTVYCLAWDFAERGPILPGTTVEYRLGTGTDPDSADSDGDWLDDATELYELGTDPWKQDTDGDGLGDGDEFALGTDPRSTDTDGDDLPDAWEVANGLDPLSDIDDDGASGDPDEDNLTNVQERQLGTDPQDPDTDNDDLDDDVEIALGTDPLNADTDGDGLLDGYEVNELGCSPFLHDTDGDGLDDEEEVVLGTSPSSADTDGDGMGDKWEHLHGFDPTVHNSQTARTDDDGDADPDNDGLTNLEEWVLGTNPHASDTDGDGLSDYAEATGGTSPCYADTDGDGLDDLQEQVLTTNPLQPDTDGDGMDDGWEHQHGFDPKTHNSDTVRTDDDANADPDGDGLANAEECMWRTNPSGVDANSDGIPDGLDSDGDGVADGVEIAQNSDPADASDGGASGSRIPLRFYFGDDSGSHSEKYRLTLEPTSGPDGETAPRTISWLNACYGAGEWKKAMLKPGWRYDVRMRWVACKNPHDGSFYPNYDYTLKVDDTTKPPCIVLDDPYGIFRTDYYGSPYYGQSYFPVLDKKATISVCKFTVEEIKFNHDMMSCSTDAVSIRRNVNEAFDTSHGEWWMGGECLKNDPVCYTGGIAPMVKAKIRVSPKINSARLSAETVGPGSPLGGLGVQTVTFANGLSDWTEFQMNATIPCTVRKADHRWAWNVSQIDGKAVTEFVCATTGPHRVYVTLDCPVEPAWRMTAGSPKNPWTNALEFVCNVANGQSTAHSALSAITSHLFYNMGFSYNNRNGGSSYFEYNCFDLSSYLIRANSAVNCDDQAYGVASLANILGIDAKLLVAMPFGYINPLNLIGVGTCNNPGFQSVNDQIRSIDDLSRSRFCYHSFVLFDFRVYDACMGPVAGMGYGPYLWQSIDYSTPEEQRVGFLSEDESVIGVKSVEVYDVYLLK